MIQEKCPYVEKCGACHMGQTTYEEELTAKKELVCIILFIIEIKSMQCLED